MREIDPITADLLQGGSRWSGFTFSNTSPSFPPPSLDQIRETANRLFEADRSRQTELFVWNGDMDGLRDELAKVGVDRARVHQGWIDLGLEMRTFMGVVLIGEPRLIARLTACDSTDTDAMGILFRIWKECRESCPGTFFRVDLTIGTTG